MMRMLLQTLVVAGLIIAANGLEVRVQGADPVPAKVEPILPPKTLNADAPPVATSACADGKCGVLNGCAAKDKSSCKLCRLCKWFAYSPTLLPCDCVQPTAFRPPVYTWISGRASTCNNPAIGPSSCGASPCCVQANAKVKHFDDPLPKPEMPKMVSKEKPIVPGSSSVLAEKKEGDPIQTINYKAMPVMPRLSDAMGSR